MTDNIIALLAKVSADVGAVRKDGYNSGQKFNFRGIDHVVNACHSALAKHGVVVVPQAKAVEYQQGTTSTGKSTTIVHLDVEYLFSCGPADDENVRVRVMSEANDSADKATAKAWSVALRTALLQVLMLPTDDADPDESYDEATPMSELEVAFSKLKSIAKAKGIMDDVKELAEENYGKKVPDLNLEEVQEMIGFAESAPA